MTADDSFTYLCAAYHLSPQARSGLLAPAINVMQQVHETACETLFIASTVRSSHNGAVLILAFSQHNMGRDYHLYRPECLQ